MTVTGYLHPDYAHSFAAFGAPLRLERAGGWLLRRRVGIGPAHDLAGPYPLFLCRDLFSVPRDLASLEGEQLASAVFVTDPFQRGSVEQALAGFDLVRPFKSHHVVPLDRPWRSFARRSSRKTARRARRELEIRRVDDPTSRAQAFWLLYRALMQRHGAEGIQRLSSEIVAAHLALPGMSLFEARSSETSVGFASFAEVGDRVYGHLIGLSEEGRERFATHGLIATALDDYQGRFEWLDLGGNPGAADDPANGVSRFKEGWATEVRTTYLCGKVLDRQLYDSLCNASGSTGSSYFPAYRAIDA